VALMPELDRSETADRAMTGPRANAPAFEQTHLISYMQLADAKAAVFLAIASGTIAYVAGHYGLGWMRGERFFGRSLLLSATTVVLVISAAIDIAVILPRKRRMDGGVTFYHDVAPIHPPGRYAELFMAMSEYDLFREQMKYCHALARICNLKYRLLNAGIVLGVVGYAMFVALLLWR
jgi:hypothetical protein